MAKVEEGKQVKGSQMSNSRITKRDVVYWNEVPLVEYTEDLARLMAERRITRSKLAEIMGVSPAYVTKVLRGDTNFTLQTMTRIALALESVVHVHVAPRGAKVIWREAYSGPDRVDDLSAPTGVSPSIRARAVSTANVEVFADSPAVANG